MSDPKHPDAKKPNPAGPDDTIIPGETATSGVDEAETGGRTKAPEGDAPDGVEVGGPGATAPGGMADDPAGEDLTDAAGGPRQGEGSKSDV